MITFIASYPHTYTVEALRGPILSPMVPPTRAITYDELFAAREIEPGTYVFTDLERLHPAEVRLAARCFRTMGAIPGIRVLNDPARVKARYPLLRSLAEAGFNDFDVYPADGLPRPRRFPVFLRVASDHAGPIGDLIGDQAELDQRLRALEADGVSPTGLLVVEFHAERGLHGFYEKFALLRVGQRITLSAVLVGPEWNVKRPRMDLVTPEIMRDHLDAIRTDRHAAALWDAFEIAGIEYGRADVGLCGGRLQVYEINTNPSIKAGDSFVSDEHRTSREIFRARFSEMLHGIDGPTGPAVPFDPGPLDRPSRHRREKAHALRSAQSPPPPTQPPPPPPQGCGPRGGIAGLMDRLRTRRR